MSKEKLKFGLALQNYVAPGESIDVKELARLASSAEQLGFTSVWVWDHLFLGSKNVFPVHESLTVLTAVAALTERIRLATGILVLPLRNPVELAKRVSTMDNLSNGRMNLGVAAGWYEREFEATGSPFHSRGKNLETYVEILKRLWTEDRITATYGRFQLRNVTMAPKPVQRPRPPIWMGGYTEKAHARLSRVADGWISYFYTPESFERGWHRILESARQAGRSPDGLGNCNMVPFRLGGGGGRNADMNTLKGFVSKYCDLPAWSEATVDSGIAGSYKDVSEAVERHQAAGVQNLVVVPAVSNLSEIEQQIEAIGREVLPSFTKT